MKSLSEKLSAQTKEFSTKEGDIKKEIATLVDSKSDLEKKLKSTEDELAEKIKAFDDKVSKQSEELSAKESDLKQQIATLTDSKLDLEKQLESTQSELSEKLKRNRFSF